MVLTILEEAGVYNMRSEAARKALNAGVEPRLALAAAMSPRMCFCTFGARCRASSCTYTRGNNRNRQSLARFHPSDFAQLQSQAKRALHIEEGGDDLSFSAIIGGKNSIDKLYEIATKRRQQSTDSRSAPTAHQQSQPQSQSKKSQSNRTGDSSDDAFSSSDDSESRTHSSDSSSDTSEPSSDGSDDGVTFEEVVSKKTKRAQQQQQQQQRGSGSHTRGGKSFSSGRSSGTTTGNATPVGMSAHSLPAGGVSTTGILRGDNSSKPPVRFEQTLPHSQSSSSSRHSRSESPSDSPRSTTSSSSAKMIDMDALAALIKGIVREEVGRMAAPPRQ
jgi:hypothetical protein